MHQTEIGLNRKAEVMPRAYVGAIALGGYATGSVLALQDVEHGPVLCPLRALTGLSCPTCGMTRASVRLGSGDPIGAIYMNPIFVATIAVLALMYIRFKDVKDQYSRTESFVKYCTISLSLRKDFLFVVPILFSIVLWTVFTNLYQLGM